MNSQATTTSRLFARFPALDRVRSVPKPLLITAVAAVVALVVAAAMWSREPEYKVLFSNLQDRDGGAIVAALGQMNVPYRFSENGSALLVPPNRVYDTRLQLAAQGLPRGGSVGYELLDTARFGASQFAEQITYQRGLEGELARSIESVNAVQSARVHLAMPRQSLFVRERQQPTASVLLHLFPGRSMSEGQVQAIAWLLASSVPELNAENVSIVDQNGRLLSTPSGDGRGMDADQTKFVRDVEQRAAERILAILNPLVGHGNVHAQVSADVDFAQRELTSEVYRPNQDPGQGAVRSRQASDSQQNGGTGAQGVPGALTNQVPANAQAPIANPPANAAAAAQQQGGATTTGTNGAAGAGGAAATAPTNVRSDSTVNYEVDRTISHVKQPTGAVKRLSVAVVVNYVKNADGEAQPLPPEELTKLTNLVREAMGFSQDRGDSLNLVNSRFTDETIAEIPLWKDPGMIDLAKTIGYWLVLLLAALWVWRALLRPMWNRYINPEVDPVVAEIERAEAQREAIDQARASANSRYEENMQRAREMATKDPRAVAMVLRTWMSSNDK